MQIFFVISGLVIAYSVEGQSTLTFAKKRVLRLVPIVWISATLAVPSAIVIFGIGPSRVAAQWLGTLLFLPNGPWIMGQFWTLPIEICFYGFVSLMIFARLGRHLEPLAWGLALASAAYFLLTGVGGWHDDHPRLTALLLLQHGGFFSLGILITRADQYGYRLRHVPLAALCLVLAGVQIRFAAQSEPSFRDINGAWPVPFAIWTLAILAIAASFHWKKALAGPLGKHAGAVRTIGLITFPLYLVHMHLGAPVMVQIVRHGYSPLIGILAATLAAVLSAFVIIAWIEPPVRRRLARLLDAVGR